MFGGRLLSMSDQCVWISKISSFLTILWAVSLSLDREITLTRLIEYQVGLVAMTGPPAYLASASSGFRFVHTTLNAFTGRSLCIVCLQLRV